MAEKKNVEQPVKPKAKAPVVKGVSVDVIMADGMRKGTHELPEELFQVQVSDRLLAQYVRVYLTNQRQGTRKVKSRGEIVSSTRKIYKQKGTGRARHGAKSAPIFVGGGVAHGPTPRDYALKLNKKQKSRALLGSLSKITKSNHLFVLDGVDSISKTKDVSKLVSTAFEKNNKRILIVYSSLKEKGIYASAQNLEHVEAVDARILNAYDVMKAQDVAFTKGALADFISLRMKN